MNKIAAILLALGVVSLPGRLAAQAVNPQVDVLTSVSVPPIAIVGTTTSLVVTNRGRANGGWNIVYVAGKVATRSNDTYCVKVGLTSAFPYSSDVSTRQPNGTYAALYPPSATGGGNLVTVATHASGGDFNDLVSFRIQSKSELSDAEATSLANQLAYVLAAPCT